MPILVSNPGLGSPGGLRPGYPASSAPLTITLTTPDIALAAPLVTPLIGAALTAPGIALTAPALQPYQATQLTPQPLIPVPIAGFGYQQSDFISLWSNAAAFFQQRVVFRATEISSATTLPSSGAISDIGYDNIIEDPYGGWSPSQGWAAPVSGWHQVTVTAWIAAPGATNTVLQVYVQTGKTANNAAESRALTATVMPNAAGGAEAVWTVYLVIGDLVTGAASIQNSGSNVSTNLTPGQNSSLEIIWLSS